MHELDSNWLFIRDPIVSLVQTPHQPAFLVQSGLETRKSTGKDPSNRTTGIVSRCVKQYTTCTGLGIHFLSFLFRPDL